MPYPNTAAKTADSILDPNAIVLYFPHPNTVTGGDVLELHIHGGLAVVKSVLGAIPRCPTTPGNPIQYAEPGEFTRRAFLNNRLDLTQVEALGDTLAAVTEQQRRLSVRGSSGNLNKRYELWRHELMYARGELEALIDFSEDQHFDESPQKLATSVALQIKNLKCQIETHSANAVRGELMRNGIRISLVGAPNAGKSSLLNRVVGREAAIVSREKGTTRDVVEVGVDIDGWFCRLGDMAGLRYRGSSEEPAQILANHMDEIGEVEQEGIKRAQQRALESDLVIVVHSIEQSSTADSVGLFISPAVIDTVEALQARGSHIVTVVNKIDRIADSKGQLPDDMIDEITRLIPATSRDYIYGISCKNAINPSIHATDPGQIQKLLKGLTKKFKSMTEPLIPEYRSITNTLDGEEHEEDSSISSSVWEESLGATQRQRLLLDESLHHLDDFLSHIKPKDSVSVSADEGEVDIVLAAESLRSAAQCLSRITGKGEAGDVEEVLGVVFEK
ncbi:MAG: mitochondrial splicing system protein [Trizodia sp. TS-e1964]|nr:MAG: mitochondrial splicing system protein [Trizodia sp. TS-e1964]